MKGNHQFLALFAVLILVLGTAWGQFLGYNPAGQTPRAFQDANGDGICDITGQPIGSGAGKSQSKSAGKKYGPGDGTGNQGSGPADGTGYGAGRGKGSGTCDGTGAQRGRSGSGNRGARGGRR